MVRKNLKLMIPGPIQPSQAVLDTMGGPVQPHYGPEFTKSYHETLELLRQVFNTQGDIFLMVGSGTVGNDACIGSSLSAGEKIIVGTNGFFGDRLVDIAESYGLIVIPVKSEWGLPLKVEDFESAFRQNPDAMAAVIVHLETSTSIVNPIREIGPVVKRYGAYFIVDAISSLGGLPVQMDEWDIDMCVSASQKCLGAPPGLSPVAIGKRGWEIIDRNPNKGHGWYSDLRVWRKFATEWGDWHPFPVTMATNNVMALQTSLHELLNEGIPQRLERYHALALKLRLALRNLGMPPFTPDELMAPVLTAAYGPVGIATEEIVEYLAEDHGIKISGGLGSLKNKIFRIGHMSPTVAEKDIDDVVKALADFKKKRGIK